MKKIDLMLSTHKGTPKKYQNKYEYIIIEMIIIELKESRKNIGKFLLAGNAFVSWLRQVVFE